MQCRGDRWDQEQVEGLNVLNIRRVGVESHVSLKKWKTAKMTLVSHSDSFLRFAVVNSHLYISRWQDLRKPLWNIGKVIQVERESQWPDPNENCTLFVFTFSELIVEGNSVLIHLKSRRCFPVFPTERTFREDQRPINVIAADSGWAWLCHKSFVPPFSRVRLIKRQKSRLTSQKRIITARKWHGIREILN